jgi:hypothetical protein
MDGMRQKQDTSVSVAAITMAANDENDAVSQQAKNDPSKNLSEWYVKELTRLE